MRLGILCLLSAVVVVRAQVPQLINYQGRVAVGGTNFDGTGQFQFALVGDGGSPVFWSNGTSSVSLGVSRGLFSVLLGDTNLAGMAEVIPPAVFTNTDVRLRVWFNDGVTGPQQLSPDQRIAAVGYALMAANVPDGSVSTGKLADNAVTSTKLADGAVTRGKIVNGTISADQLSSGAAAANLAASGQSGVATGGMILSDVDDSPDLMAAGYVKLGVVQLADAWRALSTENAPSARRFHTAVWTGNEMLVWGGGNASGHAIAGGRFSAVSNTWATISTNSAPAPRDSHTAVWAPNIGGMMIWGGYTVGNYWGDGGIYDPVSDSWSSISTNGAPSARGHHSAVWTGSEMIIWGGGDASTNLNTGARYNPQSQTWTPMAASPLSPRIWAMSVWTGTEMIIFGGYNSGSGSCSDGARYNPQSNTWTTFTGSGGYVGGQNGTAVWTGTEMIVFYGWDAGGGTFWGRAGRYHPLTSTWPSLGSVGVTWRMDHSAVWTGVEMILWGGYGTGGYLPTGLRYDPNSDIWTPCTTSGAPKARIWHSAVWTGSEMIVFGGTSATEYFNSTYAYQPSRTVFLYQKQ